MSAARAARHGLTRPLGGLALADIFIEITEESGKVFVRRTLGGLAMLKACEDRSFYAVGGTCVAVTWRGRCICGRTWISAARDARLRHIGR